MSAYISSSGCVLSIKETGRNIVNIKQLKQEIAAHAQQQQLPEEIQQWLQKTFLRWAINSFPEVVEVRTTQQFLSLTGESPPQWFIDKLGQCTFSYINPQDASFQENLTRSSEWLASKYPRLAAKFPRITVPQALRKWQKDHERMQHRRKHLLETSGSAVQACFGRGDFSIVEFLPKHPELPQEMARESYCMQHCLGEFEDVQEGSGGYGQFYLDRINGGGLRLFSLRDHQNKPHVTIALYPQDEQLWVEQIKGKQNRPPVERYIPTVQAFLTSICAYYKLHPDCLGMGLICEDGRSLHISGISDEKTLQYLVAREKKLFDKIKKPSQELCWLASLRDPNSVTLISGASEPMKIAAMLQMPLLMTELNFANQIKPKDILKQSRAFSIGKRLVKFLKIQPKRI